MVDNEIKCNSESLIRKALEVAERMYGPQSPQVGLFLVDLADCLEQSGRSEEAESITTRYRSILCLFAGQLGINDLTPESTA